MFRRSPEFVRRVDEIPARIDECVFRSEEASLVERAMPVFRLAKGRSHQRSATPTAICVVATGVPFPVPPCGLPLHAGVRRSIRGPPLLLQAAPLDQLRFSVGQQSSLHL